MHRENLKHEAKITLPVPSQSNIFGVPLEELMGRRGEKGVPKVVRDCIQFLRETGGLHILFSDFR
jgi:Rho GTPase-activating protein 1